MDTLKESQAAMIDMFHTKMDEFQKELQKSSSGTPSTSSLASEFSAFKKFIGAVLLTMQKQVEFLGLEMDRLEMRGRRKMLLLHGIPEEKSEDPAAVVTAAISEKLKIADFTCASISRCHRLGNKSDKKSRPIIIKLRDTAVRDKVWFSKKKLKGSGLTISEFLTKTRHSLFLKARQQFGISKCWTREGKVHILASNGSVYQVSCLADLDAIPTAAVAAAAKPPLASSSQNEDKTGRTKKQRK